MEQRNIVGLLKYDIPVPVDEPDEIKRNRTTVAAAGVDGDQMNRDVLNSIFPPLEFKEDQKSYQQYVSTAPASKTDVIKLKSQLETLLNSQKARKTGICLIRSDLYSKCFDEIIRQVTIENNARGRLLAKVRDHYRSLIQSYRDLYDLTLDWGHNKSLQVNLGKDDLLSYNIQLKEKKRALEIEANELQLKLESLEKRLQENKQIREKEYADELAFLKKQGQMMKLHYEQCFNRPP